MQHPSPLPARAGLGLKAAHYSDLLAAVEGRCSFGEDRTQNAGAQNADTQNAEIAADMPANPAWVEVHPQNYFCAGGPPHHWLSAIAAHLPISFHSVGLSLGSSGGVDVQELEALATVCARYQPAMVSDHLSWSSFGDHHFPDLLPVPYSQAMLDHFVIQVERVQERLGRRILIENPSHYLAYRHADMSEVDFLHSLCRRSGCGLLLDINNVEVSAFNLTYDATTWLDAIDPSLVGEIHVAGHARKADADGYEMAIDDHGATVSDRCLALAQGFITRAGPKPVLLERDSNIPSYATLAMEMQQIDRLLCRNVSQNIVQNTLQNPAVMVPSSRNSRESREYDIAS